MNSTITVSVTVYASIERVLECWTQPRHIIRWNNASDDWWTLKASNDLTPGGKFRSTMAAKDGSFSFDFEGTYDTVKKHELIAYSLSDGRKVKIAFEKQNNGVLITESFDAETENPIELQQQGWLAILNNFKKHTEGKSKIELIHF